MSIRHNQVSKDQLYKTKIKDETYLNKTVAEKSALQSMENDISEFEKKNLVKKVIDSSD